MLLRRKPVALGSITIRMPNITQFSRRPGRPQRVPRAAFLLPLAVLFLSGCEQRFGMPEPVTEQGQGVLDLWIVCMWVAIVLGGIVLSILFYSLIRHRRRNNDLPKQTEGNTKLEITYTVIPFILVAVLFGYGLKVQIEQTRIADSELAITVTGFQWNWRFEYPTEGIEIVGGPQQAGDTIESDNLPEMVLPVGKRVQFDVVAADVAHSFFVPGFLTKRDLIPGIRNKIEVTPEKVGTYVGHCAEYCGLNHSQMNFKVRVVSQADYDTWVQTEKGQEVASS